MTDSVGVVTRAYVDASRPDWEGSGPRPLPTTVWAPAGLAGARPDPGAPAAAGVGERVASTPQLPLILLSHGAGCAAAQLQWLAAALATHGYLAAAVDHLGGPGGQLRLAGWFHLADWHLWERPRDLSAVLDLLLRDADLGARIDRRRIGAAGFSAGGATVIQLAGGRLDLARLQASASPPPQLRQVLTAAIAEHEALRATNPAVRQSLGRAGDPCSDERVRSVFALSPAIGEGFTRQGLLAVRIPVGLVAGDADEVTPVAANARRYAERIADAQLTVLPGRAGHWTEADTDAERARVLAQVSQIALTFFAHTLPGAA